MSASRPTVIEIDADERGLARVTRLQPGDLVSARPVHRDGPRVRIALLGRQMSLLGGDRLTLRVRLSDDGKTVEDVSYDAEGCSISQASTSVMAEEIVGLPLAQANEKLAEFEKMITSRGQDEGDEDLIGDGVAFAGVSQYPARVKCALLGWKAFQAASADALTEVEN